MNGGSARGVPAWEAAFNVSRADARAGVETMLR
jgi:hypothetical protein